MNKHWIRRNFIYRWYMLCKAWLAWRSFGKPGSDIIYLSITGTDGKSSSCNCLYEVLKAVWIRVGIISTVFIDIGDWPESNESHMTSLDHKVFWRLIQQAEKNGVTHMVIENSSHALYQYRTRPLRFSWVAITNLTREHLDFHRTMDHYARSKAELFGRLRIGWVWLAPYGFEYRSCLDHHISHLQTFGYDERADIFVSNITQNPQLSFDLHLWDESRHIDAKLVGVFNCDNMMIAAYLAHTQWMSIDQIASWIESCKWLPGRQEIVSTAEWVSAMIDFAVTPDALQTLYTATREMWYERLIAVFGGTGNRDQGKRPKMGAIAAEFADIAIITEDENYHEDGMEIMKQIEKGVLRVWSNYEMVQDRAAAIRRWLELAQPGDIVIVTGMANYTSRAMNEWSVSWNEREVIIEQMKQLWLDPIE